MSINPKRDAWEHIGELFWTIGRPTARPDGPTIDRFLDGAATGSAVLVVGASTKDLIITAADRGATVTVVDFSPRMCSDLERALDGRSVSIVLGDITGPVPELAEVSFDLVLSDRLINRFTRAEAIRAFETMVSMSLPGSEVRTTVKYGTYAIDDRLIALGEADGTIATFWNEAERTIDFTAAAHLLEAALVPHGEIPRPQMLEWYRRRGAEARYAPSDMGWIADSVAGLALVDRVSLPRNPDCELVAYRRVSGLERTSTDAQNHGE